MSKILEEEIYGKVATPKRKILGEFIEKYVIITDNTTHWTGGRYHEKKAKCPHPYIHDHCCILIWNYSVSPPYPTWNLPEEFWSSACHLWTGESDV